MSAAGLFALGFVVTLVVSISMGLLVWGAILDGRDVRERKVAERNRLDSEQTGREPHVLTSP